MKTLKFFILTVSLLLLASLCAGVYVWYEVQEYERAIRAPQLLDVSVDMGSDSREEDGVLE
jgi:hypothetical protein